MKDNSSGNKLNKFLNFKQKIFLKLLVLGVIFLSKNSVDNSRQFQFFYKIFAMHVVYIV